MLHQALQPCIHCIQCINCSAMVSVPVTTVRLTWSRHFSSVVNQGCWSGTTQAPLRYLRHRDAAHSQNGLHCPEPSRPAKARTQSTHHHQIMDTHCQSQSQSWSQFPRPHIVTSRSALPCAGIPPHFLPHMLMRFTVRMTLAPMHDVLPPAVTISPMGYLL